MFNSINIIHEVRQETVFIEKKVYKKSLTLISVKQENIEGNAEH